MTGDCFLECLKRAGYSINGAAKRWGVDPATVHREKEKDEARGLYADAARTLLREADADPPPLSWRGGVTDKLPAHNVGAQVTARFHRS